MHEGLDEDKDHKAFAFTFSLIINSTILYFTNLIFTDSFILHKLKSISALFLDSWAKIE